MFRTSLDLIFLQSELSTLDQIIHSIKQSLTKSLNFLQLLHEGQQLLLKLENYVRIQLATITRHMPAVLLLSIFRFLPLSESRRTQLVCNRWYQTWKLPIAMQLWKVKSGGHLIAKWPGPVTHGGPAFPIALFNIRFNGENIRNFQTPHSYTGCLAVDKTGLLYINTTIFGPSSINIYSQEGTLMRTWPCLTCIFTITNDQVFVIKSSESNIYQYTLEGKLVQEWRTWPVELDPGGLAVEQDEIFITDATQHCVFVFSKDGKPLRQWGKRGAQRGEFDAPYGIVVHEELVYVVDTNNSRIQAFTRYGKFLFQFYVAAGKNLWNLCVQNNNMYITTSRELPNCYQLELQTFELD